MLSDSRILRKSYEKLASLMDQVMLEKDWQAKSLLEQQNYIKSLPEGVVQLLASDQNLSQPLGAGLESTVYKGLVNPDFAPAAGNIVQKDMPNVVVKMPNSQEGYLAPILKQFDVYKKDILANPENSSVFPWHDFNLAGAGNTVSEFAPDIADLKDLDKVTQAKLVRDFDANFNRIAKPFEDLPFTNVLDMFVKNKVVGLKPLSALKGKSGLEYVITDLADKVSGNTWHNFGRAQNGAMKAIDFLAAPVDTGFLETLKLWLRKKGL